MFVTFLIVYVLIPGGLIFGLIYYGILLYRHGRGLVSLKGCLAIGMIPPAFLLLIIGLIAFSEWQSNRFFRAACEGDKEAIERGLSRGENVNDDDLTGLSVLGCAVQNGHVEVAKLLLDNDADPHFQASSDPDSTPDYQERVSPYEMAMASGDRKMKNLFLPYASKEKK